MVEGGPAERVCVGRGFNTRRTVDCKISIECLLCITGASSASSMEAISKLPDCPLRIRGGGAAAAAVAAAVVARVGAAEISSSLPFSFLRSRVCTFGGGGSLMEANSSLPVWFRRIRGGALLLAVGPGCTPCARRHLFET